MRRLKWDNGKAWSPKSDSGEARQHHQRLVLTEGWLQCLEAKEPGAQNGQPSHREVDRPSMRLPVGRLLQGQK